MHPYLLLQASLCITLHKKQEEKTLLIHAPAPATEQSHQSDHPATLSSLHHIPIHCNDDPSLQLLVNWRDERRVFHRTSGLNKLARHKRSCPKMDPMAFQLDASSHRLKSITL